MVRSIFCGVIGLALMAVIPAAQAQTPQYWATYAYDTSTKKYGVSFGRTDRQAAINEALSRCGQAACKTGSVVLARCIAVASGTQWPPGFGFGHDQRSATTNSLNSCRRGAAGSTCESDWVRCGR